MLTFLLFLNFNLEIKNLILAQYSVMFYFCYDIFFLQNSLFCMLFWHRIIKIDTSQELKLD